MSLGGQVGISYWSKYGTPYYKLKINEYKIGYQPVLTNRKIFNNQNTIIKEEIYTYNPTPNNSYFEGMKVEQKVTFSEGFYINESINLSDTYNVYNHVSQLYDYIKYKIHMGTDLLVAKEIKEKEYIVKETYEYDQFNRIKLTTKTSSSGKKLTNEVFYPLSGSQLYSKNMMSTVIESVQKMDNLETSRIKIIYDNSVLPSSIQSSTSGVSDLRTIITYDEYDTKGNLLQFTSLDGLITTYLWSFNKLYPVAEIKNATLAEVEAQLGMTAEAFSNTNPPDMAKLNLLRNKLPKAFVTIFNYQPLVGVTDITTPSGLINYYEYDSFGRLLRTKDVNGKTVQEYKYHYQNQ